MHMFFFFVLPLSATQALGFTALSATFFSPTKSSAIITVIIIIIFGWILLSHAHNTQRTEQWRGEIELCCEEMLKKK